MVRCDPLRLQKTSNMIFTAGGFVPPVHCYQRGNPGNPFPRYVYVCVRFSVYRSGLPVHPR